MKKKEEKMECETVRNVHGIAVNQCCASCMHRDIDKQGHRTCALYDNMAVKATACCNAWEMRNALEHAGKCSGGTVKTKAYLKYVFRTRKTEQRGMSRGKLTEEHRACVEVLRQKYTEEKKASWLLF